MFDNSKEYDALVKLFVVVDDFIKLITTHVENRLLPAYAYKRGRDKGLSLSETIILALFRYQINIPDIQHYHNFLQAHYKQDFPGLPNYENFLKAIKAALPYATMMLKVIMYWNTKHNVGPSIVDSTPLAICKIIRASSNKVARGYATRSKSSQGWWYGFKLHAICDELGNILSVCFTTANVDDRKKLDDLVKFITGELLADAGYLSQQKQEELAQKGVHLLACVRNNMKKIMTHEQHQKMKKRQMIEIVFSVLKERLGIVTTLARSILYFSCNYLYTILAYELGASDFSNLIPLS